MDVIDTDFRKAFGRVSHSALSYKKMESILFDGLKSYLSDRRQFFQISVYSSRCFAVTSVVPQGSHLGPLLFIMFASDIAHLFSHSRLLLFVDDLKLVSSVHCDLDSLTS